MGNEVNARWEASALAIKAQKAFAESPLLIFDQVRNTSGELSPFPSLINMFASRTRSAAAVGSTYHGVSRDVYERRNRRIKPVVVSSSEAPVKQVVKNGSAAIDILKLLPALVHGGWDPGPYLSAGFLTTYDPDSGIDNCALQRGWIRDDGEIRIYPLASSHNGVNIAKNEALGQDTRVAFWVGHHPVVYLGAEARISYPESHWEAAGGATGEPLRLVPSESLGDDFLVPADAEFIIEGIVPRGVRKPEGPFAEYTGYFGPQRLNPVMQVTAVTHRENPYWFSIITGSADDGIGMLRREGAVFDVVNRVIPHLLNVYRPPTAPHHMYIQIRKTQEWQPRAAIAAAIAMPDAIKHVLVFDEDINIFDPQEVLWAIDTRSEWSRDLIVVPKLYSAPLDPTSDGDSCVTRVGIDCTKPAPPEVYAQRSFIPAEVMDSIRLEDYLP